MLSEDDRYSSKRKACYHSRNLKYIQYISSKDDQYLVLHAMNFELTQIDKRKTILSLFQRHEEKLLSFVDNLNIEATDADPTILDKINSIEDDKMHSSVKNYFNSGNLKMK